MFLSQRKKMDGTQLDAVTARIADNQNVNAFAFDDVVL